MDPAPNASSTSLGEWVTASLLALTLAWTTLCLGGVRPETMLWSWPLTGLLLATQLILAGWNGDRPHPASWALLPFLALAACNALLISPVPWLAKRDWLGWAHLVAIFWISLNGLRSPGPRALLVGTVVGLAGFTTLLAAYQRFIAPDWLMLGRTQVEQYLGRSSGSLGNPNHFAALLILVIPFLLSLTWQRGASAIQRIAFGYLAAVCLTGLVFTISRGSWIALVLALACWPLGLRGIAWTNRILFSGIAVGVAIAIGAALYSGMPLVKARFDNLAGDRGERSRPILWHASAQMFAEAPLLGTGAGSFNTLFERHRPERFNDEPQWTHNEYLNTLSDYGSLGTGLLLGGLGWLIVRLARTPAAQREKLFNTGWLAPDCTAALAVGLLAFAFACFVDFHLKVPSSAMMLAVLGAEVCRRFWPVQAEPSVTPARQISGILGGAAVILITLILALPAFLAESQRYRGRQKIDTLALTPNPSLNFQKETLTAARELFGEALAFDGGNAQSWADSAYASALWSHLAPASATELGREAEHYARQALALSSVCPEFWIRLGVALDLQGRRREAGDAFLKALTLAPNNSLAWYHHAYHLSLSPRAKPLALAAVETCLRLDPSYASAKSLRQRITASP